MKKENSLLTVYIIRHGEKTLDGNSLTPDGKKQVKFLANRLKDKGITKIISSDIPRCRETTEIISKFIKSPIEFTSALREVDSDSNFNPSKHKKEINAIKKFYNKLEKEEGTLLVVSSGNVNRIIFSFFLNTSPVNSRFVQNPTGLTKIEYVHNPLTKKRFVYINDTSHLPKNIRRRQVI